MRAVVQRVSRACVSVEGSVAGEIAAGLMILLGVGRDDTSAVAVTMADEDMPDAALTQHVDVLADVRDIGGDADRLPRQVHVVRRRRHAHASSDPR